MTGPFDGRKSFARPARSHALPADHRREALHLHAIGFTPSGIADELNAQFGTSYSRRSVLLELSSPASGSLRDAARHVRPEADTATASAGRRRLETPPLDDGAPMSAIGSVEAERRALRRVDRLPLAVPGIRQDRCADTRGGNTQAQAVLNPDAAYHRKLSGNSQCREQFQWGHSRRHASRRAVEHACGCAAYRWFPVYFPKLPIRVPCG